MYMDDPNNFATDNLQTIFKCHLNNTHEWHTMTVDWGISGSKCDFYVRHRGTGTYLQVAPTNQGHLVSTPGATGGTTTVSHCSKCNAIMCSVCHHTFM